MSGALSCTRIGGVTHFNSKNKYLFGIICLHSVFGMSNPFSRFG